MYRIRILDKILANTVKKITKIKKKLKTQNQKFRFKNKHIDYDERK